MSLVFVCSMLAALVAGCGDTEVLLRIEADELAADGAEFLTVRVYDTEEGRPEAPIGPFNARLDQDPLPQLVRLTPRGGEPGRRYFVVAELLTGPPGDGGTILGRAATLDRYAEGESEERTLRFTADCRGTVCPVTRRPCEGSSCDATNWAYTCVEGACVSACAPGVTDVRCPTEPAPIRPNEPPGFEEIARTDACEAPTTMASTTGGQSGIYHYLTTSGDLLAVENELTAPSIDQCVWELTFPAELQMNPPVRVNVLPEIGGRTYTELYVAMTLRLGDSTFFTGTNGVHLFEVRQGDQALAIKLPSPAGPREWDAYPIQITTGGCTDPVIEAANYGGDGTLMFPTGEFVFVEARFESDLTTGTIGASLWLNGELARSWDGIPLCGAFDRFTWNMQVGEKKGREDIAQLDSLYLSGLAVE